MTPTGSVVALDVGGTAIKAVVVDDAGRLLRTERRDTAADRGVPAVLETIGAFAQQLVATAPATVPAVGVVVPGLIDEREGVAVYASNIGWRDVPLRRLLSGRLDLPVALGHDVRAGGLAEGLLGAARGVADYLFLPIGTGIAGAVVVGGRPYAGARMFGGELGHAPAVPGGERCRCGQRGCLEAYASATSIRRRYHRAAGVDPGGAEGVIARAATGERVAARIWAQAVSALATVLAGYTMVLDPSLIVIGGGLAGAGENLFEPLRVELAGRLAFRDPPPIVAAALGSQAGCLGAAILGWRAAGNPDAGASWDPAGRCETVDRNG